MEHLFDTVVYGDDLATHGEVQVFTTIVPPYADSETRATAMAPQIDALVAKGFVDNIA